MHYENFKYTRDFKKNLYTTEHIMKIERINDVLVF